MNLSERDQKVIWHPYTQHLHQQPPVPVIRGEGTLLFDESGNAFIDAISSWWVTIHGHAHPYIAEALYRQALRLEQVIFTNFTHEPGVLLAERLLQILPGGLSKIFYSDNGSTAVEVALKMALQFWKNKDVPERKKILVFEDAYHGDTFGAMSVSARSVFTNAFRDQLFDVIVIETPNENNLNNILQSIHSRQQEIAGFIYEPLLQAAGGMKMYSATSMNTLLKYVQNEHILLIADEVLTGFGRTGQLFASETLTVKPDIICLSKGLTGGTMALGVTACNEKIFEAFLSEDKTKTLFHGHSFTANPLACTAALASLDLLEKPACAEALINLRQQHENFVQGEMGAAGDFFQNIRVLGTVLAFEVNAGKNEYSNQIGGIILQHAMKSGIYLRPLGNTVYLMPPYCIRPAELRALYDFLISLPKLLTS